MRFEFTSLLSNTKIYLEDRFSCSEHGNLLSQWSQILRSYIVLLMHAQLKGYLVPMLVVHRILDLLIANFTAAFYI